MINKKNMVSGLMMLTTIYFSTPIHANELLASSYQLPPNEIVVIKGNLITSKVLDCNMIFKSPNGNLLVFNGIKKTNWVNGTILPEGGNTFLNAFPGNRLYIELKRRGKISIMNKNDGTITLRCR